MVREGRRGGVFATPGGLCSRRHMGAWPCALTPAVFCSAQCKPAAGSCAATRSTWPPPSPCGVLAGGQPTAWPCAPTPAAPATQPAPAAGIWPSTWPSMALRTSWPSTTAPRRGPARRPVPPVPPGLGPQTSVTMRRPLPTSAAGHPPTSTALPSGTPTSGRLRTNSTPAVWRAPGHCLTTTTYLPKPPAPLWPKDRMLPP